MADSFDLEERTAVFGEKIIALCRAVPADDVNSVLIRQLVRAGTSIGANYCEANDAESKKDFRHKIGICRKEARETKHWLRMLAAASPTQRDDARRLWQEAKELNLIFSKIRRDLA
jgi:four helix bundle protein